MDWLPISSNVGVLATLSGVCAFCFWLEKVTEWKLFQFLPPFVFIYAVPMILSNVGVIINESPVYDAMDRLMLPMFLVLLLVKVNVAGALRVMGRGGIGVMLFGTLGVMVGAPIGMLVVQHWLGPDAWKAFGTLSASWIGGTANLAAVRTMIDASDTEAGLAVLADSTITVVWLSILLNSRRMTDRFNKFTGVDVERFELMERAAATEFTAPRAATMLDSLILISMALCAVWLADLVSARLPSVEPYLVQSTWRILLITTIGLALSYTPLYKIPGSQELAMALLFLFVARMGAGAKLKDVAEQALPFLIGASIWIVIHGAFCVLGAKLFRTDLATAAIASAANVGGAATATIVAKHHRQSLVPAAILMALIGYALGNYCGYLTALICRMVS